MENFDWPLLRTNLVDFWRTWHISVTSWCRQYVFTGVYAASPGSGALGMVATMLAIGLWHGLTLNFVAWGLYHGARHRCHAALERESAAAPSASAARRTSR